MSKIYAITIAYAPAVLVARSLILYQKYRCIQPYRHIVVQGHYPINEKKNTHDIKLVVDCFDNVELWDPGENLGSAQSQNWCLNRLDIGADDFFINLDPDSACLVKHWDLAMNQVLQMEPECILISCMAPMVQRYLNASGTRLQEKLANMRDTLIGIPQRPMPFNLSLWRYSFFKQIGGIPQTGLWWGDTEAKVYQACQATGKYHAYLLDYLEDERSKHMQDKEHNFYKDAHMRTPPPGQERFLGNYEEYLRKFHPRLLEIDTAKDFTDFNFP